MPRNTVTQPEVQATEEVQVPTKSVGLYAKLAKIMGELTRIPKHGRNAHFNYDFATNDDITDAIRPLLAREGIAVFVSSGTPTLDNGLTRLPLTITLVDSESNDREVMTWTGEAKDTQDKGINKAATAGIKYWLLKTFLLSTGDRADDPDDHLTPRPAFLNDALEVHKLYWWLYHDCALTPEQVTEKLGCLPLNWTNGGKRELVAVITADAVLA